MYFNSFFFCSDSKIFISSQKRTFFLQVQELKPNDPSARPRICRLKNSVLLTDSAVRLFTFRPNLQKMSYVAL